MTGKVEFFKVGDEVSVEQYYFTDPGEVIDVTPSGMTVKVKMDHGETIIFMYCENADRFVRKGLTEYEAFQSDYLVHGRTKAVNMKRAINYKD